MWQLSLHFPSLGAVVKPAMDGIWPKKGSSSEDGRWQKEGKTQGEGKKERRVTKAHSTQYSLVVSQPSTHQA